MTRVDAIIEARNPIHDPAHPKKLANFKGDIRYNNISFSYTKDMPVIQDVSLHIPAGATVALVGQSGSGKSTMADLLPRFYDVDKGSITIDGTDIRDLRVHDLRSLMGNVNQEAILFNDTIYNNITFGVKEATRDQVEQAARIANAHEFIMETEQGYDTCIGDRGCRLSGRTAPEALYSPCSAQESACAHSRRGHICARQSEREVGTGSAGATDEGPNHTRNRSSTVDNQKCRPYMRDE